MAYPINIIINDRNWYDSRIIESDPVVFQNVNYASGDNRSVNIVRQRFMQDWARQIIPNSIRQGVGLTPNTPTADDITVTQGYAVVAGRFLDIPSEVWVAGDESLDSDKWYYLIIKVADFTESDTRNSTDETAALVALPLSTPTYVKSHNELVIAKFYYNGSVISDFENYTAEQEWQASVISPVPARPGLSTGSDNILIRAGASERIDNLGIETDKTRFYLNAVFNDQDGTPIEEIKLINNLAVLQVTDLIHDDFLGMAMFNLSTGIDISGSATERIDELGNLVNIGDINGRTMGGNETTDLIDTDSTQTLSAKTLTAPIVTTGTFDTALLTTPHIVDSAGGEKYTIAVSNLSADRQITLPLLLSGDTFVFENHIQSLDNKILTADTLITSFFQDSIGGSNVITVPAINDTLVTKTTTDELSNKTMATLSFLESGGTPTQAYTITGQALSANRILTIPTNVADTFMFIDYDHTNITGIKEFSTNNIFKMTGDVWSSATHVHDNNDQGGVLNINNATTGTLAIGQGGTGLSSHSSAKILVGQSGGGLSAVTIYGDASMAQDGDMTVSYSHNHDTTYYDKTELDKYIYKQVVNEGKWTCTYEGQGTAGIEDELVESDAAVEIRTTADVNMVYTCPMPLTKGELVFYMTRVYVAVYRADDDDFIDYITVRGMGNSSSSIVQGSSQSWKTSGLKSYGFSATDCSSYNSLKIVLGTYRTSTTALEIGTVVIEGYYLQ